MKICIASVVLSLLSFNLHAKSCEELRQHDDTYYISYLDSGIGGAIFAVDSLKKITQDLRKYENEYAVKFRINHYGDTANAPYGSRSKKEISDLTFKMSDYVLSQSNHHTNILACNTASANLEKNHAKKLQEKYPNSGFITMVDTSVNAISRQSTKGDVIAIFATPSTIKSNLYQEALDKDFSVATLSPADWVKNIETSKSDDQIKKDFDLEMSAFLEKYGNEKIRKIKSVGLFCTHFPYFKKDIKKYFSQQGNEAVKIFSQGELFSDDILKDVNAHLKSLYNQRAQVLPKECRFGKPFSIDSHISGNDSMALLSSLKKMYGEEIKINVVKGEILEIRGQFAN